MTSGPNASWQIEGAKVEVVADFLFLGSKITADGDCNHDQMVLASWQEGYHKPRQCKKSRDITLLTKVCIIKAMVFPVVKCGSESWTIKEVEHGRTDTFELWCWRRLLRVPWTARRSKQSILREINPEYSLEGLTDAETNSSIFVI